MNNLTKEQTLLYNKGLNDCHENGSSEKYFQKIFEILITKDQDHERLLNALDLYFLGIEICLANKAYTDAYAKAFINLINNEISSGSLQLYHDGLEKHRGAGLDPKFYTHVLDNLLQKDFAHEDSVALLSNYFVATKIGGEFDDKEKYFASVFIELIQLKLNPKHIELYANGMAQCVKFSYHPKLYTRIFIQLVLKNENDAELEAKLELYFKSLKICKEKNHYMMLYSDVFETLIATNQSQGQILLMIDLYSQGYDLCRECNFSEEDYSYGFTALLQRTNPKDGKLEIYTEGILFCQEHKHDPRFYSLVFEEFVEFCSDDISLQAQLKLYQEKYLEKPVNTQDSDFARDYVISVKGHLMGQEY